MWVIEIENFRLTSAESQYITGFFLHFCVFSIIVGTETSQLVVVSKNILGQNCCNDSERKNDTLLSSKFQPSKRPSHQTEIVNGAHPRHVRESMLPKKTKYSYKWHHRNLSKMTMSHWEENEYTGLPFGLFDFFKHEQFIYFCRGPDDFCWDPAPVGPTLVTGSHRKWGNGWY